MRAMHKMQKCKTKNSYSNSYSRVFLLKRYFFMYYLDMDHVTSYVKILLMGIENKKIELNIFKILLFLSMKMKE